MLAPWLSGRPREIARALVPTPIRAALHRAYLASGGPPTAGQFLGQVRRTYDSDPVEVHKLLDQALIETAKGQFGIADALMSAAESRLPSRTIPPSLCIYETYYRIDCGKPIPSNDLLVSRAVHARTLVDSGKYIRSMLSSASSGNAHFWLLYRNYLDEQRAISPKKVTPFGHRTFSVSNDDGIIQEIFNRIGTSSRYFVEFGVNDGGQNNTTALLYQGWRGLWLEASSCYHVMAEYLFREFIAKGILKTACRFITAENVNQAISSNLHDGAGPEIDLLSIDVDGNDYWIWEALDCVKPRVAVIEYNSYITPPVSIVQKYEPLRMHGGTTYYGCSLEALNKLAARKGYKLVACSFVGDNAFFVREDLVGDKFYKPGDANAHFEPNRGVGFPWEHPPSHGDWQIT